MIEVNFKQLREAVVSLNKSGLIPKSIPLVGIEKDKIYEKFMNAMDKIEDDPETGEFPAGAKEALTFFNKMVDLEKKEKEGEVKSEMKEIEKADPAKLEKKQEEKAIKAPKAKAEKKETKEVKEGKEKKFNKYGHRESSQAGRIDIAFEKGGTFEEMSKELELSINRIKSHYYHMVSDKGITFVEKNGSYKIKK